MIQGWTCTLCKRRGSVRFRAAAGVWEVIQKIFDQHAKKSSDCQGGRDTIRVRSMR